MPAEVTMTLKGGKQVEAALLQIAQKTGKKVVRKAVRAGAKPISKQAKMNAKSLIGGTMGGKIARAMTIRAQRKQRPGAFAVNVLINPKKADQFVSYTAGSQSSIATGKFIKSSGKRYFIPAAIEYGHVAPGKGGTGAPKVVGPVAYTRKAFDSRKQESIRTTMKTLWQGIEQAAREAPKV